MSSELLHKFRISYRILAEALFVATTVSDIVLFAFIISQQAKM